MNAELAHFGVKGMRWGVRKNRKGTIKSKVSAVKNEARKAIREADKAAILRNVVSAGLGAGATMTATMILGNPAIAGMGVAAVQTIVTGYGEQTATQVSEQAVDWLSKAFAHGALSGEYLQHSETARSVWLKNEQIFRELFSALSSLRADELQPKEKAVGKKYIKRVIG